MDRTGSARDGQEVDERDETVNEKGQEVREEGKEACEREDVQGE